MRRTARAPKTIGVMSEVPPLSQHRQGPEAGTGRIVLWLVLFNVAFWPRIWILGFWVFGSTIGDAFSAWIVPVVGFLILPWTTLLYAWMWAINSNAVTGWEWIVVAIGLLSDLFFWIVGRASTR
jgi:hypothetical protein